MLMLCGIVRCSTALASVQVERVERYGFSLLAPALLVMSQLPVSLSVALSRRVCYLSCPSSWCEAAMCAGVLAELDMRVTIRSISGTGAVLVHRRAVNRSVIPWRE
jgi:hypothetical protein